MPELKETSTWLRAGATMHNGVGVDRDKGVLRGYVMAQQGPFKTKGRGEFDEMALRKIVALANKQPAGLKCRLAHPTLSSDGIGKFLGRVKHPRMDSVRVVGPDGRPQLKSAVRGDLYMDETAMDDPVGGGKPIGQYVLDLAESDPDALSSSLVLEADQEMRLDSRKQPMKDATGEELPPLWRPTALHASDVVDTGEAVDGILSASLGIDGLPDAVVRKAAMLLSEQFPEGTPRTVMQKRCMAWLDAALDARFGSDFLDADGTQREAKGLDPKDGDGADYRPKCMSCGNLATACMAKDDGPECYCESHMPKGGEQETSATTGKSRAVAECETYAISAQLESQGVKFLTIPGDPPGGGGVAVAGEWSAPTLGDFTDKQWGDLSDGERRSISRYYGWYSTLDSFGNLKLPHHFANGPNKGKASLNGVRNALARLNQTQGPSAEEKTKIKAHLESHMPKDK